MVSGPGALSGQRYRLDGWTASTGGARRYAARDEKLDRSVLLWLVDAPEGTPDRERLLAIARAVVPLSDPAFLRVLDVVPEPDALGVVLETSPPPVASPRDGAAAGRLALDVARALQAAAEDGLDAVRLDAAFVHAEAGEPPRIDPVGVFLESPEEPAPEGPAGLIAGFIATLLAGDAGDAAALRLRVLAEEWRGAGGRRAALLDVIGALRSLPGVDGAGATRSLAAPPPVPGDAVVIDEEDTLEMEPWTPPPPPVASAIAGAAAEPQPSPPPPASAPAGESRDVPPPPPVARRPAAETATDGAPSGWPALRLNVLVPVVAAVFVVVLGTWGLFFADESPTQQAARAPSGNSEAFGPPVEAPGPNRVTVGLAAQEDSAVRVTVDGVVEFDGVLREGQRQLWDGRQRIQVRTENGQTLLLSVNGEDLGPYSPAMGHPDWNRIDFGFWPGWEQDEVYGRGRRE